MVSITDIGEGVNDSLLCITDNPNCCKTLAMGEWYFPNNMSTVRTQGFGDSFYRNRGPMVVRLHRRYNAMRPTGPFCCEVPDANEVIQRICITVEATIPFEGIDQPCMQRLNHLYNKYPSTATSISTITPTINEQPSRITSIESSSTIASMTTTATATIEITTSITTSEVSTTMTMTEVDTTTPPDLPATTIPDSSFTGSLHFILCKLRHYSQWCKHIMISHSELCMWLAVISPYSVSLAIADIFIGVYFQLNGVSYDNSSKFIITDIGESDDGSLLCVTDNPNCCKTPAMGEWYFPNNMSTVRTQGFGDSFYRNRGPMVVRLHRRYNAMRPTGLFCCVIPDANEVIQRICITVEATVPFEGIV